MQAHPLLSEYAGGEKSMASRRCVFASVYLIKRQTIDQDQLSRPICPLPDAVCRTAIV